MSNTSEARRRIDAVLDDFSFVEIGAGVTSRTTDFNLNDEKLPSDGVVTGYGVIDGRLVYVYAQDASVLNGSVGEMHARKILRLYDMALKMGAPVIGLIDSAGMRLQEGADALTAFGTIYRKMSDASGVIPQITAIYGDCGGGLAVLSALSDFTFMEEKGRLFVNSPNAVAGNYTEKTDTASAAFKAEKSGFVDAVGTAEELPGMMRDLIGFLPSNNEDADNQADCADDLNRALAVTDASDPAVLCIDMADDHFFVETGSVYAPEMMTGFLRLDGETVGVVANRTKKTDAEGKECASYEKALTIAGCEKAARFVSFCDAFDIPVLSMTDVKGFASTMEEESGIALSAARLAASFADATVPKVNLITGEAFGSAYVAMNSQGLGADITIAWPSACVGVMDPKLAAKIVADETDQDAVQKAQEALEAEMTSAAGAVKRGVVDEVIPAADTRKYVTGAFEMLFSKREDRPGKKHGTV